MSKYAFLRHGKWLLRYVNMGRFCLSCLSVQLKSIQILRSRYSFCHVCMQTPHRQLADAGAVFALYILVNMIRRRATADPESAG